MTGVRVALFLAICALVPLLCPAQSTPLDVFLVVDNSGSMRQCDPKLAIPRTVSLFAGQLPPNSRVGILIFDRSVKVVLELSRADGREFQSDVAKALSNLKYEGPRTDLAAGVERAIYELRQRGRSDARRAIILVSDGMLDLGSSRATEESSHWLSEDLALEARRLGIIVFPVTVSESADYKLVLILARTTGGEYYRAPVPSLLPLALARVKEKLVQKVETAPANPVSPPARGPNWLFGVLVVIVLVLVVLVPVSVSRLRMRASVRSPEGLTGDVEKVSSGSSLSALREQGSAVSGALISATELLTKTNSTVNEFQVAVERYALSNYKVVREVEEQCVSLGRECILVLDHIDIMIQKAEQEGQAAVSLRATKDRLCDLLEAGQIEEIPVTVGDVFDSGVQVATSAVTSIRGEGLVAAVSRKGYGMNVRGRDVILRPAEVVVTSMHADAQAGAAEAK